MAKPMYDHDYEQAYSIHKRVMARLEAARIPPSPHHYEVLYIYLGNLNSELKDEIDTHLKSEKLSASFLEDLYEKYISDSRHEELVEKAGNEIQNTLSDVTGLVGSMRTATNEYSGTLQNVTKKIANVEGAEDIRLLMEDVAKDTAKMLEHNQQLEVQLDQSAQVMEDLKRDLERVRREAMTDGLTGIANRKAFDDALTRMCQKAEEDNQPFTLLLLDIDHFKAFNDNFGHQVGDQVLRLVAKTLTDGIKGRDTAARYGGEEFAILLPDSNVQAGKIVGDNLRKALAIKEIVNRANGAPLGRITMSVGVAEFQAGERPEDLIERADKALYTAKNNGRNQVAEAPASK